MHDNLFRSLTEGQSQNTRKKCSERLPFSSERESAEGVGEVGGNI
jgi:hypothetical protein